MEQDPLVTAGGKFISGIFKAWVVWAVFVVLVNLAIIGGIGYAIYWGLTIAERAVEQDMPTHN